jgi:DNA polymerase alpha subunit A
LYSAQHGYPDLDKCEGGGRFFERIFGARTPALEHFLLSSQLMGPSWLRVYNVEAMQCSPTHCKVSRPRSLPRPAQSFPTHPFLPSLQVDFRVPDPSQLVKLTDPPPSPPLVVLSLSLKTVVNPTTQLHEVVAVSTLTHPEVQLDGPTDLATTRNTMRQVHHPFGWALRRTRE